MVKYFNVSESSTLMKFDKVAEKITGLSNLSTDIDWLWIADEDGELDGKEIKAGDIIIRMYGIGKDRYQNKEVFIIKDEALKNYYKRMLEYYDEMRKKEECCDCEAVSCGTKCAA